MTASPAADWLPTNGKMPDLPAHTVVECRMRHRPHHTCNPAQVSDLRWNWLREPSDILEYGRLAPAQPAECDCGTGQVHSIHCKGNPRPPGERAEATINAAGQGATSDKATVASTTALKGRSAEQLPVPAAPQRQNLNCTHGRPIFGGRGLNCARCGDALQRSLPPLHRVTVERERIRFLLLSMSATANVPIPARNSIPRRKRSGWKLPPQGVCATRLAEAAKDAERWKYGKTFGFPIRKTIGPTTAAAEGWYHANMIYGTAESAIDAALASKEPPK